MSSVDTWEEALRRVFLWTLDEPVISSIPVAHLAAHHPPHAPYPLTPAPLDLFSLWRPTSLRLWHLSLPPHRPAAGALPSAGLLPSPPSTAGALSPPSFPCSPSSKVQVGRRSRTPRRRRATPGLGEGKGVWAWRHHPLSLRQASSSNDVPPSLPLR